MVSGTVSLLCERCFSPFPHGTGTLSVSGECLALADGPAGFTRGSTCPALLRCTARTTRGFAYGSLTLCGRTFQNVPLAPHVPFGAATYNPVRAKRNAHGLGSAPFARRYWGYHVCFLFLPVLRCFSSRGSPPYSYTDDGPTGRRVAPFRHRRVKGRLRLTAAFRSLPRLSSPSGAKASAMCP